jgi:hypothetical protein
MILTEGGYVKISNLDNSKHRVLSFTPSGSYISHERFKVFKTGTHPTLAVTLQGGRRLVLTGNHELSTDKGWKTASSLAVGDKITINHLNDDDGYGGHKTDDEYFSLGWLVGDGWFNGGKSWGWVFGSQEDRDCEDVVKRWLATTSITPSIQIQPNGVRCYHVWKGASALSATYGIAIAKAPHKSIPSAVFSATRRQKVSFLRALFAADGSVRTNRRNVLLSSNSPEILRGTQLLLNELGIYSGVTGTGIPPKKRKNPQYVLSVNGVSLLRFSRIVGFGPHIEKSLLLGDKLDERNDTLGRSVGFVRNPTSLPVKSIVKAGDTEVYDLALAQSPHHFIAEGVITHNCNLGSVNLARIADVKELEEVTWLAATFLYMGTFVGWLPHPLFQGVRERNRRVGLGIMGLHEWCVREGQRYEPSGKLGKWLSVWEQASNGAVDEARKQAWADGVLPAGVRAVAPTGTIGILGETTTGIEPVFCKAYKRRYLGPGQKWMYQYVCDPTVARLVQAGVDVDDIEDSYTLARDVERRLAMQAYVQEFVDQAISSTINVPEWGEPGNNNAVHFADTLLKYLPKLRGVTVFPEGARAGAPLSPIKWETAMGKEGVVYEEGGECVGGVCGL